ncbi:hypothetical protein [Chryseobacterium profundimaris]|uniref:Uncharacterized protein n=1 Tax=Chryseobacterium profundimaris TaxID=1387275 RepID=A0ABY1NII7_9FLAO|nr:hypothetical protein [Chryseobacterium profundimaris]SMP10734.1 hypothetical protein SAMN06264346_102234 [Chryseobacterium profundimaris]
MRLNNHELYDFFVESQILALYHANTVGTTITYLQNGGLLSRGAVETQGLFQTPQSSDAKDKEVNVWNDVFLDTADLHSAFRRENHYGPVLFEFNIELVRDETLEIWITKNNPIYWNPNTPDNDRYFQSVAELRQLWNVIQRQRIMITIRNNTSPILFNSVRRIIVDDPQRSIEENGQEVHLFNHAKNRIDQIIVNNHPFNGRLDVRRCNGCYCRSNYLRQRDQNDLKRLFYN